MKRKTRNNIIWSVSLIVAFGLFLVSNQWGMQKKEYNNLTVYWHSESVKNDTIIDNLVKSISVFFENKGFNLFETKQSIYLCKSDLEFCIKSITINKGVIGKNNCILKRLYIKSPDLEYGIVPASDSTLNSRPLSSVIAHELMHSYQFNKLGFIAFYFAPKWKIEGMADFLANTSSCKTKDALPLYVKGESYNNTIKCNKDIWDGTFFYFLSRVRVDYLLSHKRISEDDFWNIKYDTDKLDEEIRGAIKRGDYVFDNFEFQE
ncbi:MAG: hypothetical protein II956_05610 [Bacteroidales bacterium]|nr:hypothetical protein [Bacteroidales bacterium]